MKKSTTQYGFTIVETLVALSIFSVAVIALISITASGSSGSTYVKNKLTASYLAQEGVEIVRNLRDTASFVKASNPEDTWDAFFGTLDPIGVGATRTGGVVSKCAVPTGTVMSAGNPIGCSIELSTNSSDSPYFVRVDNCLGSPSGCRLIDTGSSFNYPLSSSNEDGFTRYITIQEVDNSGSGTPVRELLVTSYVFWTKAGVVAGHVQFTERLFDWVTNLN